MNSTQRVVLILKMLEMGQPIMRKVIAKRLRISERTIYRDLSLLKGMNVPLREVNGEYSLNKTVWAKWTNRDIGQAIRKCRK